MNDIQSVNISIGANMYNRFSDFANTPSNVLAEFVDNALQSYRDHKDELLALNSEYRFTVDIQIIMDENDRDIKEICIIDNAAGISHDRYLYAFEPAKKPEDDSGLNEFGMGLKTAACWLGDNWTVTTKALGEDMQRYFSFNMNQVTTNDLDTLPIVNTPKPLNEHYTKIHISELTKNAPNSKGVAKIKQDLASIYRLSIRNGEMRLIVNNDLLEFDEPEILKAPYYKNPEGPVLYWRKDINFVFDNYKAHGFIGLLKEMSNKHDGFVLLRRGRVVKGAENGERYHPKSLCGNVGSPRYKRIFGELELEGFKVSFNKNDFLDKDNLDALMEALKGEIHTKEFDLYSQAEGFRVDERQKQAKKLVKKHDTSKKTDRQPIEISISGKTVGNLFTNIEQSDAKIAESGNPMVYDGYEDKYKIDGKDYTLKVEFVDRGSDLFWVDVSQERQNVIICRINTGHVFFEHFGKPNDATVAVLKTLAMAKYTAKLKADNDAVKMLEFFNDYIKHTKV